MVDILYSNLFATTYILKDEKSNDAIVIDPGDNTSSRLVNHIHKIGVNIVAILLTHAHYDHITALEDVVNAFPNATTYISEDEIDILAEPKFNLSNFCEKKLRFVPGNIIALTDNEEFCLLGKTFIMIKTPFHTKGSACFYVKEDKILFSGDTLFYSSIGRTDLPSGSEKTVSNSLKKLITLPKETIVYPGHGRKTTLEREIKYNTYLKYL